MNEVAMHGLFERRLRLDDLFFQTTRLKNGTEAFLKVVLSDDFLLLYARANEVATYVELRVRASPISTLPKNLVDGITSTLTALANEIEAAATSGNIGHAANGHNYMDSIVMQAGQLPFIHPLEASASVASTVTVLQRAVASAVEEVASRTDQANARLDELSRITTASEITIRDQTTRLDVAISNFNSGELTRGQTAAEAESTRKEEFNQLLARYEKASALEFSRLSLMAEEALALVDAKRIEAEKIVEAVANVGMSSGYGKSAQSDEISMIVWNFVAVGSLIIIAGAALVLAIFSPAKDLPTFLPRIAVATPLAALSIYAGSQAASHRAAMRHARRMQLELASIDPFVALFPEGDRLALKKLLAERWFAVATPAEDAAKGSVPLIEALSGLIKNVADGLNRKS